MSWRTAYGKTDPTQLTPRQRRRLRRKVNRAIKRARRP